MKFQAVRGMRDVLPEEIPAWELLERTARELARQYGYSEVRPPLLEETELFVRSVGEVTDIVEKEMFTVQKGEHSFSLRPEGTASLVRAYLQAGYPSRARVQRLFTIGPMFRYERPQKGRERQFTQFDVEAIGSLDPRVDAELIDMAARFFESLGISGLEIRVNSLGDGEDRARFREAVRAFLEPRIHAYSPDSQKRFERNVLRVLDSKDARDVEQNRDAPRILDCLSEENRAHFDAVREHLLSLGRQTKVDASIVRGLDYYTRTIFEVHYPMLGARSALCGGGRYDHLVRDLGGPDLGAAGFAVGFSGTLLVLEELGLLKNLPAQVPQAFVVAADPNVAGEVLRVAAEMRSAGISTVYDVEGRNLKAQLRRAVADGQRIAVIVGPDELAAGTLSVKDLASAEQHQIARKDLVVRVSSLLASRPQGTEPGR